LKKDELDRNVWETRCGRNYGHVRQYRVNGYGKTDWAGRL